MEPGLIGGEAVRRVGFLSGLDEDTVFGKLCRLWGASQSLGVEVASVDQIAFWLRFSDLNQAERLIAALADPLAGFIEPCADGYKIRGNKKHIEKKQAIKERNRRVALNRVQITSKVTSTLPDGNQIESSTSPSGINLVTPSYTIPSQAIHTGEELKPYLKSLKQTWEETKKQLLGEESKCDGSEEFQILRAIRELGADQTEKILFGARFEAKTETWDPADNVSITRVLFGKASKSGVPIREKLASLASKNRKKAREVWDPEKKQYVPEGSV